MLSDLSEMFAEVAETMKHNLTDSCCRFYGTTRIQSMFSGLVPTQYVYSFYSMDLLHLVNDGAHGFGESIEIFVYFVLVGSPYNLIIDYATPAQSMSSS